MKFQITKEIYLFILNYPLKEDEFQNFNMFKLIKYGKNYTKLPNVFKKL